MQTAANILHVFFYTLHTILFILYTYIYIYICYNLPISMLVVNVPEMHVQPEKRPFFGSQADVMKALWANGVPEKLPRLCIYMGMGQNPGT